MGGSDPCWNNSPGQQGTETHSLLRDKKDLGLILLTGGLFAKGPYLWGYSEEEFAVRTFNTLFHQMFCQHIINDIILVI